METDLIKSKNLGGGVRSSNIELFRILSMITIVAHHYVVNSGLLDCIEKQAPLEFKDYFLILFGMGGKTGINCFVLITGYFMCTSNITKKKIFKLLSEVYFYRIAVWLIFFFSGYEPFSIKGFFSMLVPFLTVADNFTGCFLLFYLLIPFLNKLIHKENVSMQRRIMGKHFFPFFSANIHKYIYKLPVLKSVEKELVEDMRLFLVENLWLPNENGQYRLSVIETSSYEHCIKLFGNPKEKKFADNEQGIKVQDITWIIDDVKSELSATYLLIDKKWQLQKYQVRIKEVANNAG